MSLFTHLGAFSRLCIMKPIIISNSLRFADILTNRFLSFWTNLPRRICTAFFQMSRYSGSMLYIRCDNVNKTWNTSQDLRGSCVRHESFQSYRICKTLMYWRLLTCHQLQLHSTWSIGCHSFFLINYQALYQQTYAFHMIDTEFDLSLIHI